MNDKSRGYSAICLINPKTDANIGGCFRAAGNFGCAFVQIVGSRARKYSSDTQKAYRSIPHQFTESYQPLYNCVPVVLEITDGAVPLPEFKHPERAIYILGPEDGTLNPTKFGAQAVQVPTRHCMNLAATVAVVLYDRMLGRND